jgi:hypothetical protein
LKVAEACEIADECGLQTIGEAILNIKIHAISLFSYDELDKELKELYEDAKNYRAEESVLTLL